MALKTGSYATEAPEPCQVLTEAALRDVLRVPQGCLVRANCLGNAWEVNSKVGARLIIYTIKDGYSHLSLLFKEDFANHKANYQVLPVKSVFKNKRGEGHGLRSFIQGMAAQDF